MFHRDPNDALAIDAQHLTTVDTPGQRGPALGRTSPEIPLEVNGAAENKAGLAVLLDGIRERSGVMLVAVSYTHLDVYKRQMLGQADNLGGGVFKKRLHKNQYRSIVLTRAGCYWVYEYLFAKQDRANIEDHELADYRKLSLIHI